ncbi:MarR family transcriptional regulator [Pelagibius litoralis]|uniref:MarR family transcriptional regulator n=1 Tax=Pelagibius litoralis TaxID=374515 RepID=A0A967C5K2_9PROT|nr:MarR family transcriptional regulator [Pelagibius litoralis]NIA68940.1 MarR family transcriptional regulator [Pelagibius litoralis]
MSSLSEQTQLSDPNESDESQPAEGFILDHQVQHLLRRAHQRASSIFLTVLADAQLTPTQFFAMARLHETGKLSQNRLGRMAAMDPATIQGVIRRLQERGFIVRLPDPNDRRRMVLSLSPLGQETVSSMLTDARRIGGEILAPLDPEERETFMSLLKKLV